MPYKNIPPPAGEKISIDKGRLTVPDNPIIPFIRGDGTGPDIWAASMRVFDTAGKKDRLVRIIRWASLVAEASPVLGELISRQCLL